ncbi:MAG TPA: fumarate reductase subunit FrdD [Usitatibacter sp.]|nr:fumarate reductase subunit FrdD [Usitatibacter sp.]
MRKRSSQPFFWLLFGAGGMLSALLGMGLVLVTGVAAPLGLEPPSVMSYGDVLAFGRNGAGKAFLFAVVSLFLWHGAHRIFHTLHDLGVHAGLVAKLACYGGALVGTVVAAAALLWIGF